MDGEAGWWTTSGNIGLPPLARVMGVGRQQQHKMHVPEWTIMGIGQDWEEQEEEEKQEIVEYSEPMGAVRGVGKGIPEHINDMFDRASAGVGEDEAVALKLLLRECMV